MNYNNITNNNNNNNKTNSFFTKKKIIILKIDVDHDNNFQTKKILSFLTGKSA